jgi:hypothetical protein
MQKLLVGFAHLFGGAMTSQHQQYSAWTVRGLALSALIVVGQLLFGSAALAKARPPEQAAAEFYRWYMQSLAIGQDPLKQSPVQLSAYVSPGLIADLKRRMSRKGLRADYFIQAQDFMEDWTTDIKATRPQVQGGVATVVVVLGASEETRRRLVLTLTMDAGDWKISVVRLA